MPPPVRQYVRHAPSPRGRIDLSTPDSAETINSDSTGQPNTAQPAEPEPQVTAASEAQPVNSEAQLTADTAMNAPPARPQTDSALRRSRWKSSFDAYKRLAKLSSMPRRQFRDSDRVTAT